MTITPKTTVHTLLKEHPFLLDFLAGYNPEFKKLTNPVMRRTMGRMATLDTVARQGNVPLNQLMNDIASEIEAKTGSRPSITDTPGIESIDPARLEELHAIVKELHAGKSVEEVKPRFEELSKDGRIIGIPLRDKALVRSEFRDLLVRHGVRTRLDFDSDLIVVGRCANLVYSWYDRPISVRIPERRKPIEMGPSEYRFAR